MSTLAMASATRRRVGEPRAPWRAALEEADASSGHDTIRFEIPGSGVHTIEPTSEFDVITDPAGVTIDGYSQAGSRVNTATHGTNAVIMIELRGQGTGADDIDGIGSIRSPAKRRARSLAIYGFRLQVRLFGGSSSDNVIVGNHLGTNAAATFVDTSPAQHRTACTSNRGPREP